MSSSCNPRNCLENRRIIFDAGNPYVLHFRIDGVFISDQNTKRCDCFIIYNQPDGQRIAFLFLIEIKGHRYTLTEVQTKLQNTRDILNNDVFNSLGQICQFSAIQQLLPKFYQTRAIVSLVIQSLERIRTKKFQFLPVLCATKSKKSKRPKRYKSVNKMASLLSKYRIQNGKDKIPIYYFDYEDNNSDVIAEFRRKYIQ